MGAAVGAGVTAAERYWAYRMQSANSDLLRAMNEVRRDIRYDLSVSREILQAILLAQNETIQALRNANNQFMRNVGLVEKAREVAHRAEQNSQVIQVTTNNYVHVAQHVPQLHADASTKALIDDLRASTTDADKANLAFKDAQQERALRYDETVRQRSGVRR